MPYFKKHRTIYGKTCPYCKEDYRTISKHQIYCSTRCAGKARKKDQDEALGYQQKAFGIIPPYIQLAWGNSP